MYMYASKYTIFFPVNFCFFSWGGEESGKANPRSSASLFFSAVLRSWQRRRSCCLFFFLLSLSRVAFLRQESTAARKKRKRIKMHQRFWRCDGEEMQERPSKHSFCCCCCCCSALLFSSFFFRLCLSFPLFVGQLRMIRSARVDGAPYRWVLTVWLLIDSPFFFFYHAAAGAAAAWTTAVRGSVPLFLPQREREAESHSWHFASF